MCAMCVYKGVILKRLSSYVVEVQHCTHYTQCKADTTAVEISSSTSLEEVKGEVCKPEPAQTVKVFSIVYRCVTLNLWSLRPSEEHDSGWMY